MATSGKVMQAKDLHDGHRHSFLKLVEIGLASGKLGNGERSDALDICQVLGFHRTKDVRLEALKDSCEQK